MKYILENVKKREGNSFRKLSLLVDGSKISYVNNRIERLKHVRMNTSGFYLSAGKIMNDFVLGKEIDYKQFKERVNELIKMGCTTVVTYCEIPYERQFTKCMKRTRHNMINCSIDYIVGIKIRSQLLTPSLIRKCKQEKVPIILVEIESHIELEEVIWERVKEALNHYQVLIIPIRKGENGDQKTEENWRKYIAKKNILTYISFPQAHTAFDKNLCKLIGLYPRKGELLVGSDVDYNLYHENETNNHVCPNVVVLRGKVLKVNDQIHYQPGFGQEVKIKVPGQFIPIHFSQ